MTTVLSTTPLLLAGLEEQCGKLPKEGTLALSPDHLSYLDITDAYIHQLFPLLQATSATKPRYFGRGMAGAHISLIYPEEKIQLQPKDLADKHSFSVESAFTAILGNKRYYALKVQAPSLISLRKRYGLAAELTFKQQLVPLHITIGVSAL